MYKKVKSKNVMAMIMAVAMALGAAGCGESQIPDLTDSQIELIEEFVAATVMKYEVNHKSRLVELSETELQQPIEPVPTITPETPDMPGEQLPDEGTSNTGTPKPVEYTIEEVLELPEGVTIAFLGHKFCYDYPDDSEIDGFILSASEGKKLLVLEFAVFNTSGQEQTVDLLSLNAIYGCTVNEDYTRRALRTMLPEDLSTYSGNISAGGSIEGVLVVEVDEGMDENISALVFNVKNNSKAFSIQLL